eukprot:TRINITY_DN10599_c1_g1_i1.p1 TRINITY_DN10599_c1_g1~~TRINITY_DN10599_c1_g1_i1.p1  ORF type:complete len:256 (-),score=47.45 TRINITY_DN10599_c1_g1_i1:171-938(-)
MAQRWEDGLLMEGSWAVLGDAGTDYTFAGGHAGVPQKAPLTPVGVLGLGALSAAALGGGVDAGAATSAADSSAFEPFPFYRPLASLSSVTTCKTVSEVPSFTMIVQDGLAGFPPEMVDKLTTWAQGGQGTKRSRRGGRCAAGAIGRAKQRGRSMPGRLRKTIAARLEETLESCELRLRELEEREELGDQQEPIAVREGSLDLSNRLENLAAELLDCSCRRDVPGATEMFEQVSTLLDRLANLLERCREHSMFGTP